ncbi:polysaccharide biosynthesis protein [gut metagenome]|uniref:Polysaccharide biosynthesis protein n=1 Tax=gut metagenome TaxID=749906 RepID=J9G6W4_9ZZZZ
MASNNTLRESTAKGFFWGALSNGTQQVVTMLIGIIMARTLSASDYGMVAMLSVFSILAGNLQESGFTSALCVKKAPVTKTTTPCSGSASS